MGKSLTRKIIESHFVSGDMTPGKEIFIKVDQTLTHDINAVMTYLAFEDRAGPCPHGVQRQLPRSQFIICR